MDAFLSNQTNTVDIFNSGADHIVIDERQLFKAYDSLQNYEITFSSQIAQDYFVKKGISPRDLKHPEGSIHIRVSREKLIEMVRSESPATARWLETAYTPLIDEIFYAAESEDFISADESLVIVELI